MWFQLCQWYFETLSWKEIPEVGEGPGHGFWSSVFAFGQAASHLCLSFLIFGKVYI